MVSGADQVGGVNVTKLIIVADLGFRRYLAQSSSTEAYAASHPRSFSPHGTAARADSHVL